MSALKRCTKCGNEYPATAEYFYRKEKTRNVLRPECRLCRNEYMQQWRDANREKTRDAQRRYRQKRTKRYMEHNRASSRRWRAANPEKKRENGRQYHEANAEKVRDLKRQYREANAEKVRESYRQWARANPAKVVAYSRNRRARKRAVGGKHTAADIQTQLDRQKSKCYWCGCKLEKYHVDHVIPITRGGSNDPSNLVISCSHCNTSKGAKLPHEWEGSGGKLL